MPETPNWNLLPGNPLKFFQLQRGCDQRALKRAYGKLIRQFKPEKFPEEFKKIRAAYEQLQQEIEYAHWEEEQETTPGYQITIDEKPESGSEESSTESSRESIIINGPIPTLMGVSVDPSWKTRIEKENPEDLYAELETKAPKQPEDYLKLAILSDVVYDQPEPGEPPQFETWLLRGIELTSEPYTLVSVLWTYFEHIPEDRFIDDSQLVQYLLHLAEVINTHRFFRLTVPLWFKLLREAPLETFREALDRCETILFDPNEQEKLVFYIQMLNAMQWKIDEARRVAHTHGLYRPEFDELAYWLDTKKEYLESHYDLLPFYNLDNVFDQTEMIRSYHNSLGRFLNQDHAVLRRRFHEMLRDYILNTPEIAQEKLIQFQLSVLQDDSEILECFSTSLEDEKNFLNLWTWMVNDCPAMHTEPETEPEKMEANATQFLRQCRRVKMAGDSDLDEDAGRKKLARLIIPASVFVPLVTGFSYLAIKYIPFKTDLDDVNFFFGCIYTFLATGASYIMANVIRAAMLKGIRRRIRKKIDTVQQYQKCLQPIWITFLSNNHWQYESVIEHFLSRKDKQRGESVYLFYNYAIRDTGALIVALARRFLP